MHVCTGFCVDVCFHFTWRPRYRAHVRACALPATPLPLCDTVCTCSLNYATAYDFELQPSAAWLFFQSGVAPASLGLAMLLCYGPSWLGVS